MSETTGLFLITGVTGKTGVPTVELLRQRGFRVRALVHTLMNARRSCTSRPPKSYKVICSTSTHRWPEDTIIERL
jgi:nucleoside-diphosphate-sugar epimerase